MVSLYTFLISYWYRYCTLPFSMRTSAVHRINRMWVFLVHFCVFFFVSYLWGSKDPNCSMGEGETTVDGSPVEVGSWSFHLHPFTAGFVHLWLHQQYRFIFVVLKRQSRTAHVIVAACPPPQDAMVTTRMVSASLVLFSLNIGTCCFVEDPR